MTISLFSEAVAFRLVILFGLAFMLGCSPKIDEEQLFFHMQKGLALSDQGDQSAALKEFRAARDMAPMLWDAHFELGKALAAQNRNAEAVLEFRRAIDLNPDYAPVYRELGKALKEGGFFQAALHNYTIAIDKMPLDKLTLQHAMVLKEKAELLRLSKDCEKALVYYDRALKILPRYPRALVESGWCLKEVGNYLLSEKRIRKGLENSPKIVIGLAGDGELDLLKESVAYGGDIDIQADRNEQFTPLMAAVSKDHFKVAVWLLRQGADPNIANRCGTTALHIAVRRKNSGMVGILEKHGAKSDIRDCLGVLPGEFLMK